MPLRGSDQVYTPQRRLATINRRFAAEPRAALSARRALESVLSEFDPAEFQVAALLTTELIANSIEHSGTGPVGSVHLEVTLTNEFLRVEVGDEGPGFEPAARAPDAPLDSHWGLHLVEQLADRWGVTSEPQTLVWFELEKSPPLRKRTPTEDQLFTRSGAAHGSTQQESYTVNGSASESVSVRDPRQASRQA